MILSHNETKCATCILWTLPRCSIVYLVLTLCVRLACSPFKMWFLFMPIGPRGLEA